MARSDDFCEEKLHRVRRLFFDTCVCFCKTVFSEAVDTVALNGVLKSRVLKGKATFQR